jgi:hypothetical protein
MVMSDIDRQRYAAVQLLRLLGYVWRAGEWASVHKPVGVPADFLAAADALHDEIAEQCEDLAGVVEGSDEERELERLMALAQAYEAMRPRD